MSNPLYKKLGLAHGQKVILRNIPQNYFDLLVEVPDVEEAEDKDQADFVHIFESTLEALEISFVEAFSRLSPKGMIWVSWPKKTSSVPTDLDYYAVKSVAIKFGMVDVKVSAIDEIWTACKYVVPIKNRK
jgi:hypothetical protein